MITRWTWHGGGLAAARPHFGEGAEPWLDLSTGINPHPWPHAAAPAIDWQRLPEEADLRALEAAAARHFDADPALVCALPGTEVGLRLIGDWLPGPAFYATPSYRTHAAMIVGAAPIASDDLSAADGATLILANPNNPDGRLRDAAVMRDLLACRGAGWLVVDEAFADTSPATSIARDVQAGQRLVVFRSFGKFFGLAGLRLGFVLGPPELIATVRDRLGAWPLSAAALAIGTAAYADSAWIAAMRRQLAEDAQALDTMLARHGLHAVGDCPLFRLVAVDDAQGLFERLARRAILTRPFDLHPRWLRLGLPADAQELARLEAALADG